MTQQKHQGASFGSAHDPSRSRTIHVLQLTDPHLMASADGALLGINTRESLDAVIATAKAEPVQPDLILVTGDLAQDGSVEAYQVLADKLKQFDCPSYWLAGNHDNAGVLATVAGPVSGQKQIVLNHWQVLLLDSSVKGDVAGWLADDELAFLEQSLREYPELPALVALHHHPVDIESGWMDAIGLKNREAFWAVIDRHPQVKTVLWGHVHQTLDQQRGGVRLLATPSTCIQFEVGSDAFSVEETAPGYRWLTLSPAGKLTTQVKRVLNYEGKIDRSSTGY